MCVKPLNCTCKNGFKMVNSMLCRFCTIFLKAGCYQCGKTQALPSRQPFWRTAGKRCERVSWDPAMPLSIYIVADAPSSLYPEHPQSPRAGEVGSQHPSPTQSHLSGDRQELRHQYVSSLTPWMGTIGGMFPIISQSSPAEWSLFAHRLVHSLTHCH